MNSNDQQCEQFEPLVSAMLDGELSPTELDQVNNHLAKCDSCRQLRNKFASVDKSVLRLGEFDCPTDQGSITETFVITRQKPELKNWLSVWRLVPVAAVAALSIGMFLVISHPASKATADQLTPEQFVKPMTDLNRINQQQQRDQELMLRTLGMDLRSLKLELNQLENAGSEDRVRLENQIEEILNRVEQFEER